MLKRIKVYLMVPVVLIGLLGESVNANPRAEPRTVLIVDESGSMGELSWLGAFLQAAQAGGKTERGSVEAEKFALVLYTSYARPVLFNSQSFGSIEDVAEVLGSANRGSGGEEDGYQAIRKALDLYADRSQNGLHLLLFTDEDRDRLDNQESFNELLVDLKKSNVLFDVVVKAVFTCEDGRDAVAMTADRVGYVLSEDGSAGEALVRCENVEAHPIGSDAETTVPDYVELAHRLGGTAWQIQASKLDGRLRLVPDLQKHLSEEIVARRLAVAPAFGEALRTRWLEQFPPILVARINTSPSSVAVGEVVTFNGAGSKHMDPNEYVNSWIWDFDDNGTQDAWGDVVATSFDTAGDHVVVLQIADRNGNTTDMHVTIRVE